jgi:anti-sigma regulatory factor (Ser/Thr protein kinase)
VLLLHDFAVSTVRDEVGSGVAADVTVHGAEAVSPHWSWADVVRIHPARAVALLAECDVSGTSIAAAEFRGAARSIARLDLPPWLALSHLDAAASGLAEPVTMTYAVLDAVSGEASVAQAGALPPVAFAAGDRPTVVSVPVTAPLGLGRRGFDDVTVGVAWRAGLVIRDAASLGPAARVASGLTGGDVERAAEKIVAARPVGAHLVVLSRRGRAPGVVRRRIPALAQAPRIARRFAERATRRWSVDASALGWVVGEAVSNVVRHSADSRTLELRCARLDDGALIEVVDSSAAPPRVRLSSWLDDSGRGLAVISALVTDWGFRWATEGKVVWAHVRAAR